MKVFIWERVEDCGSGSYHEEGGMVVIAETLDRAVAIAVEKGAKFKESETPDAIHDLVDSATPESFYRMPDAGCC